MKTNNNINSYKSFITNKDITIVKGAYCAIPNNEVFIPKGSKVDYIHNEYFVNPELFEKNSFNRHDAVYYGFRVSQFDVDKVEN